MKLAEWSKMSRTKLYERCSGRSGADNDFEAKTLLIASSALECYAWQVTAAIAGDRVY